VAVGRETLAWDGHSCPSQLTLSFEVAHGVQHQPRMATGAFVFLLTAQSEGRACAPLDKG
jgi:hypothetical protein